MMNNTSGKRNCRVVTKNLSLFIKALIVTMLDEHW